MYTVRDTSEETRYDDCPTWLFFLSVLEKDKTNNVDIFEFVTIIMNSTRS